MDEGQILGFKGKVDFTQAKKDVKEFEKYLSSVGISLPKDATAKAFDTKPLTEYQKEVIRIKQETLDLAKAKAETAKADRAASLATQAALREEVKIKKEQIAAEKLLAAERAKAFKKPGEIISSADSSSQFANSTVRSESIINNERVARAGLNTELAKQAVLNVELSLIGSTANRTAAESVSTTQKVALSKKELAKLLAEEKYLQSQATKELKNRIREDLNAKGSTEQRRAALIRLQTAFDRLSATERATPAGQRLEGIVSRLNTQVLTLEKGTGRAGRNVGNYLNQAWGGLKTIANILPGVGLAGLLAFAIDPLVAYLQTLDLFKAKIDPLKDAQADLSKKMGESGAAAAKATLEVDDMRQKFQQARDGIISKESALKSYNDGIGKTLGFTNDLNVAEERTIKNGDAFVELMFKKAKAAALMSLYTEEMSKAALELAKTDEEAGDYILSGTKGKNLKNAKGLDTYEDNAKRNRETAAKVFQDKGDVFKKLYLKSNEEIAEFAKANQLTIEEGKMLSTTAAINAAASFSEKLTKLHRDSSRKVLDSDDAEIQSVKDKYKTFGEEADKFYQKYGNKAVVKLNGKNVSRSEVTGVLKADEQSEIDAIGQKRQAEKDKKEREEKQKHYEKLLSEFADYGQKMDNLEAEFQKDSLALANDPRQLAVRKAAYEADKQALIDSNSKKLDEYEKLIEGIELLSRKEALAALEIARKQLASDKGAGVVSEKVAKETEKLFDKTQKAIIKGTKAAGEEMITLANQMDQLVSSVGGIDTAFGKVLSTVSNVVGQVGNIKKGVSDFKEADTGLGKLTAGLGVLGAGISIFKTVFSLFDRSQQREEQAAYSRDLQNKQTEALNKALERQISLLNDAYGTDRIKKYSEAIQQAQENESKYQGQLQNRFVLTGDKQMDRLLTQVNNGEKLSGDVNQIVKFYKSIQGGQFSKLPTDIAELQRLLDEGRLDASTATIVQNLIQANKSAQELANNLRAENVGAGLSTVVDEFMDSLTDGIDGVEDVLSKAIRRGLLNSLKGDITEKFLQDYYEMLDKALVDGNISADEDALLREQLKKADEYGKKRLDYINSVSPETPGTTPDPMALKPNTLTASVNQPTAERLEGLWRGNFDLTKQLVTIAQSSGLTMGDMLQIGKSKLAALERIAVSTETTAGHTARLEAIENNLTAIAANTKPVKSIRD
jgi:hypothetical protein